MKTIQNKVKDTSNNVSFLPEQLWKHRDGSMELIPTMPTSKIKKTILPEIEKRIVEKTASIQVFNQKKLECERVLIQRGEMEPSSAYEEKIFHLLITIPSDILERACEYAFLSSRSLVRIQTESHVLWLIVE